MKNIKLGVIATCVCATVLGAQLASFAWYKNPTSNGTAIGDLCTAEASSGTSNRQPWECVDAKCKSLYGSGNSNYNSCVDGAVKEMQSPIVPPVG